LSSYTDLSIHQFMLSDSVRTLAFEQAIRSVIRPEHTVLDFGCGTGILAFFSHRAGARRVYAVDRSSLVVAAQAVARANGFDRIEFFCDDEVNLPAPVDVIVSEWMGHFVFNETMLEPLLHARDRCLRAGGMMIPRRLTFHAAVVTDPGFYERYAYFDNRPFGIDFSSLSASSFARTETRNLKPTQVARTVIPLGELDMSTCHETPRVLAGWARFAEPVTAYGLVGWFDADLAEGIGFGTGPFSPKTHWSQMAFPLRSPFTVEAGEPLHVQIEPVAVEQDVRRHWRWTISQGAREAGEDELAAKSWYLDPPPPGRLP
jgi:type I protein arginine methyltransferase